MNDATTGPGNKCGPRFNVASGSANLGKPVEGFREYFYDQGWQGTLPDDCGWMPVSEFPDQVVGQVAIRDELAALIAVAFGRVQPYTKRQARNFMHEGRVIEHCDWPIQSISAIRNDALHAIAVELVEAKARRGRRIVTDCSSGSRAVRRLDAAD